MMNVVYFSRYFLLGLLSFFFMIFFEKKSGDDLLLHYSKLGWVSLFVLLVLVWPFFIMFLIFDYFTE